MDETPVWNDMISKTSVEKTGATEVPLKSTGNKKVRVSACLTGKADGTKCKPLFVFAGAERESKVLRKEFKWKCSIATLVNVWINELLTMRWCNEIYNNF